MELDAWVAQGKNTGSIPEWEVSEGLCGWPWESDGGVFGAELCRVT